MIRMALITLLAFAFGSFAAAAETETPPARLATDQWCWTHDLPKDKCVTCDKKLIPGLKKDNDWCKEHSCAESTCVECDPKAKAKLDALRPLEKPKDAK